MKGGIEAGFLEEAALSRAWGGDRWAQLPGSSYHMHGLSGLLEGPGMEKGPGAAWFPVPVSTPPPSHVLESEERTQAIFAKLSQQLQGRRQEEGLRPRGLLALVPLGGLWAGLLQPGDESGGLASSRDEAEVTAGCRMDTS